MSYFDQFNQQENEQESTRERGELKNLVDGKAHTIARVNPCKSRYGDAFVFEVQDDEQHYFFSNAPLTKIFKQAETDGMLKEIGSVEVTFEMRHSEKNNIDFVVPVFGEEVPF